MDNIIIITFSHSNVGGYLFEESVNNIFSKKYKIISIKNDTLIENELLNNINNSIAIIVAGGPIIGNNGPYKDCWMGFLKLNPDLNLIKVPIILFGVGLISVPFKEDKLSLTNNNIIFLKEKIKYIYTRDKLTYEYLKSYNIKSYFMGCPSIMYKNTLNLNIDKNKNKTVLFSPTIFINEYDIEVFNKLKEKFNQIKICINHDDIGVQNKAKNVFLDVPIINLKNLNDMFNITNNIDYHIGYRVHQHIACLLSGVKSILIICDNRGKGISEVIGNFKYSINNILELDNKLLDLENDNYENAYNDIKIIRNNIINTFNIL